MPTVWDRFKREIRAGQRRWQGTDLGDRYQKLAASGEGPYQDFTPAERPVTDHIHPGRPGSVIYLVNLVTERTGQDAAEWRLDRLMSMVSVIYQRGQQRQQARQTDS